MNSRRGSTLSPIRCIEHLIGLDRIFDTHLQHRPALRIHRRLPELFGIHLSKTFVPLDVHLRAFAEFGMISSRSFSFCAYRTTLFRLDLEQRRLRDIDIARLDDLAHVAVEERQQQACGYARRRRRHRS